MTDLPTKIHLPTEDQVVVLAALQSCDAETNGVVLSDILKTKPSHVYNVLYRLAEHGLVHSRTKGQGLRSTIRLYTITDAGRQSVKLYERVERLRTGQEPL